MRIGVIGAGVVGLTTALELQNQFRNAEIEIVADKFGEDTTSYVAAGVFRPGTSFSGPNIDVTRKWINDAYNHWDEIANSSEGGEAGVCSLSCYMFSSTDKSIVRNHYIEKLVPIYRQASEEELKICPGDWKYGSYFQTLLTEFSIYQIWAMEKYLKNGGKIKIQTIQTLISLQNQYDVIVNCCGLGAKTLCSDIKIVPIRGQVIKVYAPWIKTAFYGEFDTYIVPGYQTVTLGGCRNFDSYNLNISKYDSASIRERCEALLPSLKTAKVVKELVGLRPHRDPVRVELELLHSANGMLKVVHNYGHGGYGVTTAPGTAKYAVNLVKDVLKGHSRL
uniref:Putative d-aspartate oxidase n=1 Tax=Corethrella appendiculata TaxID=1370023 RepID=U5ESP7_9DIPT